MKTYEKVLRNGDLVATLQVLPHDGRRVKELNLVTNKLARFVPENIVWLLSKMEQCIGSFS